MYLDSFLKLAGLEDSDITDAVAQLVAISEKYGVDFTISVSKDAEELSEQVRSKIVISL